jgi:hypothetical protein
MVEQANKLDLQEFERLVDEVIKGFGEVPYRGTKLHDACMKMYDLGVGVGGNSVPKR